MADNSMAYNKSINKVLQRTDYSGNGGLGAAQQAIKASSSYTSSPDGKGTFNNRSNDDDGDDTKTPKGTSSSGGNALSYLEALRDRQRADAEAAYANARNALNEAYNSASNAYGNIYNSGVDQLGRSYDNSRGKINSEATDAFREAYVNRMLSEKNLGQRLAAMGMSGGASESTLAGLINNYGNARNGIQRTLDTNLGDLEMKYQGNLADLYNAYQSNMASIAQQKASQLANLEMQLANLNANMGNDYYSMLMSNVGNLQNVMSNAVSNQNAYQAPEAQTVTNTFNPANTTQTNDVGSRSTNWWREYIENLRNQGMIEGGIQQNLIRQGLTDAEIARLMSA